MDSSSIICCTMKYSKKKQKSTVALEFFFTLKKIIKIITYEMIYSKAALNAQILML